MESPREHIERINRQAEAERGPGDPKATRPRDMRWPIIILSAAVAVAIVMLGVMFFGNDRYVAPPSSVAQQHR